MDSRKLISRPLLAEGMHQGRIVGLTSLCVLEIAVFLEFFIIHLNYADSGPVAGRTVVSSTLGFNPLLTVVMYVVAPLMVLYLFRFLNTRTGSDFYGSIPPTRSCLYASWMLAIVVWLLLICFIPSMTAAFLYNVFESRYLLVNVLSLLKMSFNAFAGSLLMAGGFALGMSLTGTVFSNLVISLLLLFLPRYVVTLFLAFIPEQTSLISFTMFQFPFSLEYNVLTAYPYALITDETYGIYNIKAGLYTLAAALIYLAFAWTAFCLRRNESNGKSAYNRLWQTVFCTLIGFVICLPITLVFVLDRRGNQAEDPLTYIVLYVIALVICALYELITTRRFKSLARLLPITGVLAVLCGLSIGVMDSQTALVRSFTPDASEVTSIQIKSGYASNDYFEYSLSQLRLQDADVIEAATQALKVTAERDVQQDVSGRQYSEYEITFHTATRSVTRNVRFYNDRQTLSATEWEDLLTSKVDLQLIYKMPELTGLYSLNVSNCDSTSQTAEELYAMLREETTGNTAYWTAYMAGGDFYALPHITLSISRGDSNSYVVPFPITSDTPHTLQAIFDSQESVSDSDAVEETLSNWKELCNQDPANFGSCTLVFIDGMHYEYLYLNSWWINDVIQWADAEEAAQYNELLPSLTPIMQELQSKWIDQLQEYLETPADPSQPYCIITIDSDVYATYYISLSFDKLTDDFWNLMVFSDSGLAWDVDDLADAVEEWKKTGQLSYVTNLKSDYGFSQDASDPIDDSIGEL